MLLRPLSPRPPASSRRHPSPAAFGVIAPACAVAVAAADMSSGAPLWATSPVILTTSTPACFPPTLSVVGKQLWVSFASPQAPFILDATTGAVLASNFFVPNAGSVVCNLFAPEYAVCAAPAALVTIYSTASMPPTPVWSNEMEALLIAPDQGPTGQLVAMTGLYQPRQVSGFDLATGSLSWTMVAPWSGAGSSVFAYDDAGTLWVAWQGYDAAQRYSAIVATFDISTGAAPTPQANVSLPLPANAGAPPNLVGLVLSNNGRLGYLTWFDGADTNIHTLTATQGALAVKGAVFSAPGAAQVQAIPSPQNGQLIIGQQTAAGQPSMAVYA